MKYLSHLNKYFFKYKKLLIWGLVFVILSNFFRVLQPQWIREALDLVIVNLETYNLVKEFQDKNIIVKTLGLQIMYFGLGVLIAALLMGLFMYYMRQTIIVMSRLIEYDMRKELFDHYLILDQGFYRRNSTGDLMARLTEDISRVRMYLGPGILYGINLLFLFIFVIWSMLNVNVTLTIYSLLPLPVLSITIYYVSMVINKKSETIQKQLSFLNTISQEVFSGIRVIKAYVQEANINKWFARESNDYKTKSMELVKVDSMFFPVMLLIIGASTIITVYVGAVQVSRGEVTPGNIAEFIIYVNMLTWPVTSIGWIASLIQRAEASQKRLMEFLSEEPSINNAPAAINSGKLGDIIFENVSFVYPDTGIRAVKDFSLRINQGDKVLVMGRTGSGKTTLIELMSRLFDRTSGKIEIGGTDIRDYDLTYLRKEIGYVPQDVFLFSDTISNNIAFGNYDMSFDEIEEHAKNAVVYDDILKLPQQFDTKIGERGVSLSGGQKQRISIARAFAVNPQVLLLDDCLSAVDTNTEQSILEYFDEAFKEKTVVVVSHRVYNLLSFDKIIILDNGTILEMGTQKELLEKGGYYATVYDQQKNEDSQIKSSF